MPAGLALDAPTQYAITGVAATDVITATGNTFVNGSEVVIPEMVGGDGLEADTICYVRDKSGDTFKLALTPNGAAIEFTTDISSGVISLKPIGKISGANTESGLDDIYVTAHNKDGASNPILLVINTNPASAIVTFPGISASWDLLTGVVTWFGSAGGAPSAGPSFFTKYRDGFLVAVQIMRGSQVIAPTIADNKLALSLWPADGGKAFELSCVSKQQGSGTGTFYVLFVKLTDKRIAGLVSADLRNFADVKGELEGLMTNPIATFGDETLRLSSQTFGVRIAGDKSQLAA